MTDVALVPWEETLDLALEGGDLRLDLGLETACLLSLFTDGLAEQAEVPADDDRRGWWASGLLSTDQDFFGSRLWLLERAVLVDPTLARMEGQVREALAWLVDRDLAERLDVAARRLDREVASVSVVVVRGDAAARADLWDAELRASLDLAGARVSILTRR